MATKKKPAATPPDLTADPTAVKDPATWTTGDEPMTGAQESYVHTLARQAGEELDQALDLRSGNVLRHRRFLRTASGPEAAAGPW